jgi:hypothetical protein
MTLDEFFAALEKTPRDWFGAPSVRRRGAFVAQCPITAVAGFGEREDFWKYGDPGCWADAARHLGLRIRDARKIVSAADLRGSLRKRLLAACGIEGSSRANEPAGRGDA